MSNFAIVLVFTSARHCSIERQYFLPCIIFPCIINSKSQNEDHSHAPRYNFQLPNCLYGRTEIRTRAPDINLDYRHLPHLTACGMRLKYFSNRSLTIQQRFTISTPLAWHYPLNCRPTSNRPHLSNLLVRAHMSSPEKTWSFPTKLSAGGGGLGFILASRHSLSLLWRLTGIYLDSETTSPPGVLLIR